MKRSVIVIIVFLSIVCCDNKNVKFCKLSNEGYPSEREEYHKLRYPNPTESQKKISEKQWKEMIANSSFKDADISGWDELGPSNAGGRVRAVAIHPNNNDIIVIGAVSGGIYRTTNRGENWTKVTNDPETPHVTFIEYDNFNFATLYACTGEVIGSTNSLLFGEGILKSTDGGLSWFSIGTWNDLNGNTIQAPPYISKIISHPNDQDRLFSCGTEPNFFRGSLFESLDAGQTWNEIYRSPFINDFSIMDIEIDWTTDNIFLGSSEHAFVSINDGFTFTTLTQSQNATPPGSILLPNSQCNNRRCELAICEDNPSTIYLQWYIDQCDTNSDNQTEECTSIYKSIDSGQSWILQSLNCGPDNINTRLNHPLGGQGNYDNALWVHPGDCDQLLIGGVYLWGSDDSAINMEIVDLDQSDDSHADYHILVSENGFCESSSLPRRIYIGNDGGIYYATVVGQFTGAGTVCRDVGDNDDVTLSKAFSSDLPITQFYGIAANLDGSVILGGTQDNGSHQRSINSFGLPNWSMVTTNDGGNCAIDTDGYPRYTSSQFMRLYRRLNASGDWCNLLRLDGLAVDHPNQSNCSGVPFTSISDNPLFIPPMFLDDNDDIFVAGERLWYSENNGDSWIQGSPLLPNATLQERLSTIDVENNSIILGSDSGKLFLSQIGPSTQSTDWSDISPITTSALVTDAKISNLNSNRMIVSYSSYSNSNLFITNDSGANWTSISPLTQEPILSVVFHPDNDNWIYIGTINGILASEDGGKSWSLMSQYVNNEGPVFVAIDDLVWQGDGSVYNEYYLIAGTHGRGIWKSEDPILNRLYVDKNYDGIEVGTFDQPYSTFINALERAGDNSEIIFLSSGNHEEIPASAASVIADKRITITLDNNGSDSPLPVVIK